MKIKVFFILVLAFFLITRLYKIGTLPNSVYWDEASIGYNAYSIGTDLKDEWGSFLPLHFRAFGEFKLPVYIYSVTTFVKILELNAMAVRIPAVLYSLGSVIVLYFLTAKITGKKWMGILSSFLLSVSPCFFIFSRTGYEVTAGLFFFLLGTYFLLSIEQKRIYLFFGFIFYIITIYSYNSFRIYSPIFLAILLIYYLFKLKEKKKYIGILLMSVFVFITSLIPIYRLYKLDYGGTRFVQVGIKSTTDFARNYISHFSPNFLFVSGDGNSRSQIPGHGELYWIDLPFLLIGLYAIFRKKTFLYFVPLIFLLIAPIPAALTKESPHALRSLLLAPSFAMLSVFGVGFIAEKFKKYFALIITVVVMAYYFSFEGYAVDFVTKYQTFSATDWQYQYKEIFSKQKSGVVSDKYGQPYIFALFYQKYPPSMFRNTVKYNPVNDWGFSLVKSFGDFQFVKE